jgi:dTDP-4-dehydrorhamnose 3,5-epimerase
MKFEPTPLAGAYTITLTPFEDERGRFARTYCKNEFAQIGHDKEWVQINHSLTRHKGTIRGMHFQYPPAAEIKLIRCVAGKVLDVIVDLRKTSATYLQWFGTELSADNDRMIYIPEGFAHGFQALEDNAALIYHHSQFYQPGTEGGLHYNDPALAIAWPLPLTLISDRDQSHPFINNDFKGI